MSSYSDVMQKRQDYNPDSPDCANVLLFRSDTPVISVEQGTTFGLTKMLYESIGGLGKIIGLRQRRKSSTLPLACIVTQDQTILTEREYDIILHGGNKPRERRLNEKSPSYRDQAVNTYITLKQHAQIAWVDSFSNRKQTSSWDKDPSSMGDRMEITTDTTGDGDEGLGTRFDEQLRQNLIPVRNVLDYLPMQNGMRIDYVERDERTLDSHRVSPRDSTSPSTDSPGESNQNSPSQVEQSRPHKRKWQCFYCKKFFVCRSAYDNHERTHTGEKPFQCTVCGRCFAHQGNLKQHLLIHREVKPHVCDICGRGFTRSNRLRDHKRSHSDNRYELLMRTKVKWTKAQKISTESRARLGPVVPSGFNEAKSNDENQQTLPGNIE